MRKQTIQNGFTIIEVMVAVTIGLIILAGVSQIFLANRTTYRLQEASANVQENGRFGMAFLTRDVRMVGFMGCASSKTVAITNNIDINKSSSDVDNTVATFDGTNTLRGYAYSGTFPTELTNLGLSATSVVNGTDVLYLQRAENCAGGDIVCHNNTNTSGKNCPGVTTGATNSAEYKIADNTECGIKKNDIVLISNCVTADVHGVTNTPSGSIHVTIAHGANLNKSPKLANSYGDGSSIYKMTAEVYYLGFGVSGEPALYRRILRTDTLQSEELVEGVYGMTIVYGEDTDGDTIANRYVPAANVTNWDDVVNVRITLHTRSLQDNVLADNDTYTYNGANVTDRRLRRDFTTTIAIRNRMK